MTKALAIISLLFLSVINNIQAQRVFVTDKRHEADYLVYKTPYFSEANLVICRALSIQDTVNKYHWFFVSDKFRSDIVIFYTKNMKEADYRVFFTNRKGLLGSYYAHSKVDTIIPHTRAYTITPQK